MNQYEHVKFVIQRFDNLYDSVNNKGLFYIGLNTFLFGGICVGYMSLINKVDTNIWLWLCLAFLVIASFLSIIYTIIAIKPYCRDNYSNGRTTSLMYYGGIAQYEVSFLHDKFSRQTEDQILADAIQQMHSLARGLNSKFKRLRVASIMLLIQFYLLIPLIVLILLNYKTDNI